MSLTPRISVLTSAYRSEPCLDSFLEDLLRQSIFGQLELVLVLNAPSAAERQSARDFSAAYPGQIQILETKAVETLGASWNRAWRAARAPLLAIWNVDDRRLSDSLERQAAALEDHPAWFLAYGDYLAVSEYGLAHGERRYTPPFSSLLFQRGLPQGGAFWLLRAVAAEHSGYFDEQFKVGPDFDYSLRMAMAGLSMGRVDGLLGYFTAADLGLSTRDGASQSAVDRTAIQLRYGVFDKVDRSLMKVAQSYDLDHVLSFGRWQPLDQILPGYAAQRSWRRLLWPLTWLRYGMRGFLRRLGLLGSLHRLVERLWRREI